jgi:hypothetical protein
MSEIVEALILAWCQKHVKRFYGWPAHMIVHPDDRAALKILVDTDLVKIARHRFL